MRIPEDRYTFRLFVHARVAVASAFIAKNESDLTMSKAVDKAGILPVVVIDRVRSGLYAKR